VSAREEKKPMLTTSMRYQVCKLALFVLGISERQFFTRFDEWERAQMLATYQIATIDIPWLQSAHPATPRT
jgi:hypothetical protein